MTGWAGSAARLAVVVLAATGRTAVAEEGRTAEGEASVVESEGGRYETVVTATREEEARFETPRSIGVLHEEALLERAPRSLPEALAETPGVFFQLTNRGAGAPILRGMIGPHNLIVVDGVRFNTSVFRTGPNQYLSTIDPYGVRRVEVVRGPSSVLYGDGAMGGVVQVLTKDPEPGVRSVIGEATARFRSADLSPGVNAAATVRLFPDMAALVGGGYGRYGALRTGGGGEALLSDYQEAAWRAKAVWRPGAGWTATVAYFGVFLDDAGRTDQLGRGDVRFYDNQDHLAYVAASWRGGGALSRLRATLSYHRADERVERVTCVTTGGVVGDAAACAARDPGAVTRLRRYQDVVDVFGASLDSTWRLPEMPVFIVVGAEAYQDFVGSSLLDARAEDGFVFVPSERGNFSDGSRYRTAGLFAHVTATAADFGRVGRLETRFGFRVSSFAASAPDVPDVGDVEYEHSGTVRSAGLQFVRPGVFQVYASLLEGFRAPNLQETTVLGDTGSKFEIPNADLAPERSDTLEIGGRLSRGPFEMSSVWFYTELEDVIDERPAMLPTGETQVDGKPVIQRVNAARGVYRGVETEVGVDLGPVTLSGAASWLWGDVFPEGQPGRPARRVPPFFGRAGLRWQPPGKRFFAEAFLQWAGRQDRLHPSDEEDPRICEDPPLSGRLSDPCPGTPGWLTLNARGGLRLRPDLMLSASVLNITDDRYRYHGSGVDAPGLDARLSLSAHF